MEIITSMSEPKKQQNKKVTCEIPGQFILFFCTYINFACTSCLSKVEKVCSTINIKDQIHKTQKSYALKTDVLPESRDIHCLVMNFGVHGLGELTLIQKKTEGISKLHVI